MGRFFEKLGGFSKAEFTLSTHQPSITGSITGRKAGNPGGEPLRQSTPEPF
jgi:hypothetical protein